MIDIETGNERNLKNIRQIGTPSEEDRIYIENSAYQRVHDEDYAAKRVFIFMGHTECEKGRYTTFVEAAIPVRDLDFSQNVPQWNNHAWSDIFREIKRSYENSIIVGWALDIKGFVPRMTVELEQMHREQFGGAHQVLFLMDSMEGEEYFYLNKGSRLQQKEGFYIYFSPQKETQKAEVSVELPEEKRQRTTRLQEQPEPETVTPHYRDSVRQSETGGSHKASSYAMTAAVVLLVGLIGVGVYQDRIKLPGVQEVVSMIKGTDGQQAGAEVLVGTQVPDHEESSQVDSQISETLNLVPVEEAPMGEVPSLDEKAEIDLEDRPDVTKAKGSEQKDSDDTGKVDQDTDQTKDNESEKSEETSADIPEYYTVKEGDTLTGICKHVYGSTEKLEVLAEVNELENSDDIRVGQKLLLP